MERRPWRYVTLEGYAVEGGFDGPYQPSTCFRPTIALGRHDGPGDADGLWQDYEQVLDLVPAMGFDGVRLNVEWTRIEPHRSQIDDGALSRYVDATNHARSLGLVVTIVIVDAAWPAWLGLEAWLLPWVAPQMMEHARRVVRAVLPDGVVVFAQPESLIHGFLDESAPPWRRRARADADMARAQIDAITRALRHDPDVGPRMVDGVTVRVDQSLEEIRAALATDRDEVYVRSLVRGHGPSASAGLLVKDADGWRVDASEELLEVLR